MEPTVFIPILAILVTLWVLLRRDFVKGLAVAVFICVSMTTLLRIHFPGFPAFTIHRLILLELAYVWWRRHRLSELRRVPLIGCFAFWAVASLFSLVGTEIDFETSFQTFLSFVLEAFVFYSVVATSIETREDAYRVLRGAWLGLAVVALLATIEKKTGFNPVERFIPGATEGDNLVQGVVATYPHRILLGTAMAVGVSLSLMLVQARSWAGKVPRYFWPATALLGMATYYGQSRGPWIGLALACTFIFVMGSLDVRKKLIILGVAAILVMASRPGIVETLSHFVSDTVDKDSFKGGTAQYRMELWKIAFAKVCESPWKFLFGYGPSAGSKITFEWRLSYRNELYLVDSWDNHFAYALFQYGFVGLIATLLLYLKGLAMCFSSWRRAGEDMRDVLACLIASAGVVIWMMTNVLIFAKQIDFLYWSIVAAGLVMARASDASSTLMSAPKAKATAELDPAAAAFVEP